MIDKLVAEEFYINSFHGLNANSQAQELSREEIREYLSANYQFDGPSRIEGVTSDVDVLMRSWTERGADPMHFGLFRPSIDEVAVAAESLVARRDPNLATREFAPGANQIERHTLSLIGRRFGTAFEKCCAHFTSGGQESNHTAVVVALTNRFARFAEQGARALPCQPVFYISQEGHHSFDKIAVSTGLGRAALRRIACDDDLKIDLGALRKQIEMDRACGLAPFMVIGTAGTTGAGTIDPLEALAEIATDYKVWFHVDAAYGGAVALSQRLRPMLRGIERADSITCDAHKLMGVPVGAGMFFCHHVSAVQRAFAVDAPYLAGGSSEDPYQSSMQWSRRFIGLKVFTILAARGMPEIARRIEHQVEMGDVLRKRLRSGGWKVMNNTPLPIVCFWHEEFDRDPSLADRIVARLLASEEAWLTTARLCGRKVLRACVTNHKTGPQHIERLVATMVTMMQSGDKFDG